MENVESLPCSKKPATGPCWEPDEPVCLFQSYSLKLTVSPYTYLCNHNASN